MVRLAAGEIAMSIFYCHQCQKNVDSDWVPCVEDPGGKFWIMCETHATPFYCWSCNQWLTAGDVLQHATLGHSISKKWGGKENDTITTADIRNADIRSQNG